MEGFVFLESMDPLCSTNDSENCCRFCELFDNSFQVD
jgi:hypothetical protein